MWAAPMLPGVPQQASPSSKSTSTPRTSLTMSWTHRGIQSTECLNQAGARRVRHGFQHQCGHPYCQDRRTARTACCGSPQVSSRPIGTSHSRLLTRCGSRQGTWVLSYTWAVLCEGTIRLGLLIEDSQFRPSECQKRYSDPLDLGCIANLEDLIKVVQHLLDLAVCKQQWKATRLGSGVMAVRL